jgi:hypothetical protein
VAHGHAVVSLPHPVGQSAGKHPKGEDMPIRLLLPTLLLASVLPTEARAGSDEATACLRTGETEANEYGEHFHQVRNTCPYDVVIFYCRVVGASVHPDWASDACGNVARTQRSAFPPAARELGMGNLDAPSSGKTAIKSSAGWLDAFREFENPFRKPSKPAKELVQEIGPAPASLFIIRAGQDFISCTVAFSDFAPRAAIVPSACPADDYLGGRCTPDAHAVWRSLGSPFLPEEAIQALGRRTPGDAQMPKPTPSVPPGNGC